MGNRWGNSGWCFLGSKITADGDSSHEIKRRLLLGRQVMINLDSILKSRDITLSTKVRLVKAIVFPVVMHGCESWTIKKAEHRGINAFELWCWRRPLRVPWTAAGQASLSITNSRIHPTHVHCAGDAIQLSHPLSSPSPPALNLSQHQGLFKWVSSPHQVAKVLEFQLQHQSFQRTLRTDFL